MTMVNPTTEQKNLYSRFAYYLNCHGGSMEANDAVYYDFLDDELLRHEELVVAVSLCKTLYKGIAYVLHRGGREVGVSGGGFYLTKNSFDILHSLPHEMLPQPMPIELPPIMPLKYEPFRLEDIDLEQFTNYFPEKNKRKEGDEWTKDELVDLLTNEAHKVGKMLGPGYDLLEEIHGEWMQEWLVNPESFRVVVHQAHRDSYKSSSLRLCLAIWLILQPQKTFILIRKSEDAVKELINGVSKILDTPLFQNFINILHPDVAKRGGFKKTTDTALAIDTNLNVSLSGEYQLRALGLGSPLTGKHSSIIVTDDICFIAGTKIATPFGKVDIEKLKINDLVVTPFGCKKIKKVMNREAEVITNVGLTGTADHPVYNKNKNRFDLLDISCDNDLSRFNLKELVEWKIAEKLLSGMTGNGSALEESIISCGHLMDRGLERCFIEQYGKNIMVKYLPTMSYIMLTIIQAITVLKILSAYHFMNIKKCTCSSVSNGVRKILKKKLGQNNSNGCALRQGWQYQCKILKKCMNIVEKTFTKKQNAQSVGQYIVPTSEDLQGCAESVGSKKTVGSIGRKRNSKTKQILAILMLSAWNVKRFIRQIRPQEIKTDFAKTVQHEKDIEKKIFQRVYNIEVDDCHVYYANDVLVHNCTTADRESDAERRATISKYQEMMNLLSNNKGFSDTRIINIGTPWHEEDVFSLMERGLKEKTEEQKKLEDIPIKERSPEQHKRLRKLDKKRGKFVYNCYETSLMTNEDIEWKRKVLNDEVLFAANYMLSLVSDDEKPFPRMNNVGNYNRGYFAEADEVLAHIDAKYAGEDTCALTIGSHNWETNHTIVYGRLWKMSIDQNYIELAEVMEQCEVDKLFIETNTDKGLMGDRFRGLGFEVESYHESLNKHIKIVSTIRPFWREGQSEDFPSVQFVEETDPEYLLQIHNYKKGVRKDDAPDSLASLILRSKFETMPISISWVG